VKNALAYRDTELHKVVKGFIEQGHGMIPVKLLGGKLNYSFCKLDRFLGE